jgi:glycine betaine/proline transport system permease protein
MTAVSLPRTASRVDPRNSRRALVGIAIAVVVVLYLIFQGQWTLPHDDGAPIFKTLNGIRDWVDANRTSSPLFIYLFDPIRIAIDNLVMAIDSVLALLGWPGILAVSGALGLIFGGWRLAALAVFGFAGLGVLGLWESSIATLGLVLAAVVLSLVIGIPLGIIAGRSKRVAGFLSPILDVMQIMPTFAYLAPMTLLFLIGGPSATIATLIYAIPPAIRITALGIRGVGATTVEAAVSLGSTRWQVLSKVQLPLARRTIGIGVNQTIMMALSMVVITALIGAPGLGADILRAVHAVDVGKAFDAGLAIVILAIVLDRLTDRAGVWMDPRYRPAQSGRRRQWIVGGAVAIVIGAIVIARLLPDPAVFPAGLRISFVEPINAIVDWIRSNLTGVTGAIRDVFSYGLLNPLQTVLTSAPAWLVIGAVFGLAWFISGLRSAGIAAACLILLAAMSLWEHGMQTLTTVLVATAVTLAIGLLTGILSARSDSFRSAIRPTLDMAQTMPAFVYLIPAVALFGASRFTAIVASIIYATPAVIRLVDAGIREVSPTIVEAATAAGSTERQLLWKVQLPLSRHALLLAANQGIVLVLAMVVVGALVGAGALGYDVIAGFAQRPDFGKGLAAGIAIVLLGIMLDRITQGVGGRRPTDVTEGA